MTGTPPRGRWADKLEKHRERYQRRGTLYRVAWVVGGVLVTLAGLVMLVTPGPAFVLIPAGLAMLSFEFAWAEAALEKALEQAEKAQQKARNADTKRKVATVLACVLVVAAVVGAVLYWDINVPVLHPA
jgi:uncharacterized protein (TIGR02611 family)